MTNITLRYNSQNLSTTLQIDGKPLSLNCLGTGEGHSIGDWKGAFFGELSKKCNFGPGSECRIAFFGDDEGYAAIEAEMANYSGRNSGVVFELEKVEEKVEAALKCRNCGIELPPNARFCLACGTQTGAPKCEKCGKELPPNAKFCLECGTPVEEKAKTASPEPAKAGEKTAAQYLEKAKEYGNKGNRDEAFKELNEGIEKFPMDSDLVFTRGLFLTGIGNHENAIRDFTETIRLSPDYTIVYNFRGHTYNQIKEYDKALADANEAIRLDPNVAAFYDTRATARMGKGDYNGALKDYNKAIELDDSVAEFFFNRGDLYFCINNNEAALQDSTKAIQLNPDYTAAYERRGIIYYAQRLYDAAIKDFTKVIRLDPSNTDAYYLRGYFYLEQGQYDAAIRDYNKVIKLDKKNIASHRGRGLAYKEVGEYESALEDFNTAIELFNEEAVIEDDYLAELYYLRGTNYTWLEKWDKAKSDYKTAVRLNPDNKEYKKALKEL